MYPIMLNVRDEKCLVVGGGGVALRKVEGLLREGARVTVVAKQPHQALLDKAAEKSITLCQRPYCQDDVAGQVLVFAATDDREVNRQVFEQAKAAGIPVNVADDPPLCTFFLPSRVQQDPFQLAIASAGEAPFAVRRLRQHLEKHFGPEWSSWCRTAAGFRQQVRSLNLPQQESERCYDRFFENTFDTGALTVRTPTQAEQNRWLSNAEHSVDAKGFVSLVGSGPGDPGLLTIRGRQRLLAADAVVYDHLAETALPCDLPRHVELHNVGKFSGNHAVPQDQINALLVELAQQGKRVVRFKGGDPYVFGRGGEEAEYLRDNGITFEVVPAVTAGVAVPAYAGIPVTHRQDASRLTLVTAHESAKQSGPRVRWDLLAKDPGSTLVGYMGVASFANVVEQLLQGGMEATTPAAMIERGATSRQRVVTGTLKNLPDLIVEQQVKPPALFVIGPAVRHASSLDWFARRQLMGQRIAMVHSTDHWAGALELQGAEIVPLVLPITPAAQIVLDALPITGWILRNAEQAQSLLPLRAQETAATAWCLDADTATAANSAGWTEVKTLSEATVESLIGQLSQTKTDL